MLHAGGRFQISLNYYPNSSVRNFLAKPSPLKLRIVNNNVVVKNFVSKEKLRFSIPKYNAGPIKIVTKGDVRGFRTSQQFTGRIKPFTSDGSFQFATSENFLNSYNMDLELGLYSIDSNINLFANRILTTSSNYIVDVKNINITKSNDFNITLDSSQYSINNSIALLINRLISIDKGLIVLNSNIPLFVNRSIITESNQNLINSNINLLANRLVSLNNTFISLDINPNILISRIISFDRGQYTVNLLPNILTNRLLLADKESIFINFNSPLSVVRFISAESNQSLINSNLDLFANRSLFINNNFINIDFIASPSIGRIINAESYQAGIFSNVNLLTNRLITIDKGVYNLQVGIDSVTLSRVIEAASSNYTTEGKQAQLFLNRYLNAEVGYIFISSAVNLESTVSPTNIVILYFDLSINRESSFVLRR